MWYNIVHMKLYCKCSAFRLSTHFGSVSLTHTHTHTHTHRRESESWNFMSAVADLCVRCDHVLKVIRSVWDHPNGTQNTHFGGGARPRQFYVRWVSVLDLCGTSDKPAFKMIHLSRPSGVTCVKSKMNMCCEVQNDLEDKMNLLLWEGICSKSSTG